MVMVMRILIVEDEYNLADVIASRLEKEKYLVDISTDGEDGYYKAVSNIYDLIILDVMLPNKDGFDILHHIREKGIQSKVIMLTAKSTLENKLNGFSIGANDYVTKPFHIDELVARVNVQLKGIYALKKDYIEYDDLKLSISQSKLICKSTNQEVDLVCKEFQLLEYFINNQGIILSKEQIYDKVWGMENTIESNCLEAYLSFVRRKLKAIGSHVKIQAVRGLGYRLVIDNEKIKA